jgi:acetyl-CoA synthetase
MADRGLYPPPDDFKGRAHIGSMEEYEALYGQSVEDPEAFWREQAERIHWFEPFDRVKDVSYDPHDVHIRWYVGGKTNACYNAVDRHVEAGHGDRPALIFEPDALGGRGAHHLRRPPARGLAARERPEGSRACGRGTA